MTLKSQTQNEFLNDCTLRFNDTSRQKVDKTCQTSQYTVKVPVNCSLDHYRARLGPINIDVYNFIVNRKGGRKNACLLWLPTPNRAEQATRHLAILKFKTNGRQIRCLFTSRWYGLILFSGLAIRLLKLNFEKIVI